MPTHDSEMRSVVNGHKVYPSLQGAYYSCPNATQVLNYRIDSTCCQDCQKPLDLSLLDEKTGKKDRPQES